MPASSASSTRPTADAFFFSVDALEWQRLAQPHSATMDHRGLVPLGDRLLTVGGMLGGQRVTGQVAAYTLQLR